MENIVRVDDSGTVITSIETSFSDVMTCITACKSSIEASNGAIPDEIKGEVNSGYSGIQEALGNLLEVCQSLNEATIGSINAYLNIENEGDTLVGETHSNGLTLGNLELSFGAYGLTMTKNLSPNSRMGEEFFAGLASNGIGTYDAKTGMYDFTSSDGKKYRYDAKNGMFYYNGKKMPIGLFYPSGHSDLSTCNTVTYFGGYHLNLGQGEAGDQGYWHSFKDGSKSFVLDQKKHQGVYRYLQTDTDVISIIPQTPSDLAGHLYKGDYLDLTSSCLDFVTEITNQKDGSHNIAFGISGGGEVAANFAIHNDKVDTITMINGCISDDVYDFNALKNKKIIFYSSKADDLRMGKAHYEGIKRYNNSSIKSLYHLMQDGHPDVTFYTSNSDISSSSGWTQMMSTSHRHKENCYYRPSRFIPSEFQGENLTSDMVFTSINGSDYQDVLDSSGKVRIVYLGDDYQESFIKQANIMDFIEHSDLMATLSANQYNVN